MAFIQDLSSGLGDLSLENKETNVLFVSGSLKLKDFHKFDSAATCQSLFAPRFTCALLVVVDADLNSVGANRGVG